jgi:patatin-like phospholipase/acyl hydrolase
MKNFYQPNSNNSHSPFNILVLDGGGSKGLYTIGILKELEHHVGSLLYKHFHLIYGTSTGAIIAVLLAMGKSVEEIEQLYLELIPKVLDADTPEEKTQKMLKAGLNVFSDIDFNDLLTEIGIVALNYDSMESIVFKSDINGVHSNDPDFYPGQGCKLTKAILASCAAYPVFDIVELQTEKFGHLRAVDGGYIVGSPITFALKDAVDTHKARPEDISILNIGTGEFQDKPIDTHQGILDSLYLSYFLARLYIARTYAYFSHEDHTIQNVQLLRVNGTFDDVATNMIETDEDVLKKMLHAGELTFSEYKDKIQNIFHFPVYKNVS